MKRLALPILVFAVLGLASLFVPGPNGSLLRTYAEFDAPRLVLLVLAFAMGGVAAGLAMRGVRSWHGYVAFGGFALAMVKARVWTLLGTFKDLPLQLELLTVGITGGVIFALFAAIGEQREQAAA